MIEFNRTCIAADEFAVIKLLDNCDNLKVGDIWLPETAASNGRLAHGVVQSIGKIASDTIGVKAGDYVMFDRLSTFAHTAPICCVKHNNIICMTDENKSEYLPLRNMVFVEPDQKEAVQNIGGVYVTSEYDKRLMTGIITKENVDSDKFNKSVLTVGSRVMLSKGADVVDVNGTRIHIYKEDMIVCKIED